MTERKISFDYPSNFLHALTEGKNARSFRNTSRDQLAGIRYALSTLSEDAQRWIRLRFQEQRSSEEAAEALGLCPEEEKRLEKDTLRKLRQTSRWNWIQYGIEGNTKRLLTQARADSYRQGYQKGLENGRTGKFPDSPNAETLSLPIQSLPLSARIHNALDRAGFSTLGELLALDEYEILRIHGLGAGGADKVGRLLVEMGLGGTAWEQYLKL